MFAFLFDRRSGLTTGLVLAVLALLLFGGGVLVGLNLRWSRDDLTAAVLAPPPLKSALEGEAGGLKPKEQRAASAKGAGSASGSTSGASSPASLDDSTDASREQTPSGEVPPEGWVPMTEGAPPPGGSR